jgi:hypothetical protein
MMQRILVLAALVAGLAAPLGRAQAAFSPLTPEERAVKSALSSLVRQEDQAILSGEQKRLQDVFLPGKTSREALGEAKERRRFLRAWAAARGLEVTSVEVSLRTPHITFRTRDRVQVFAVVSEAYTYRYAGETVEHGFGLGVRHDYFLRREGGRWYIQADYFTDPLDQDTRIPQPATPESGVAVRGPAPTKVGDAGGRDAAAYADRYCGAAPGCGNGGLYNSHYNNYNGEGGDCTNFVSQALKAGGLRESPSWNYDERRGEGSRAWSNAEGLRDYLDGSGRADIFAGGRYADVTRPTLRHPQGAARDLQLGDLITYIERGTAVHSGLVVGFDERGVPLVDTHTSDRYHVPWDLGWDRTTRYLFWHVHYPQPRPAPAPSAHGR